MNTSEDRSSEIQALLDAAMDAVILIDHRGAIEVFNRSAERLFGYEAREVVGQNVRLLMGEAEQRQHDAYIERYERSGVPHIIGIGREVLARRKDGSLVATFLSVGRVAGAVPPRYVGFLQDLTLRNQALGAVVRERDRASRFLEAAQTILVALDLQHHVTLVNRKGCEILGGRNRGCSVSIGSRRWFPPRSGRGHGRIFRPTSRANPSIPTMWSIRCSRARAWYASSPGAMSRWRNPPRA